MEKVKIQAGVDVIATAFPRNRDGFLCPPSLEQLVVRQEILEAAEEIFSLSEDQPLSLTALELLVRVVLYSDRVLEGSCQDLKQ